MTLVSIYFSAYNEIDRVFKHPIISNITISE